MTGQRRRFPRNSYVIRLELLADDLRTWAGIYAEMASDGQAHRLGVPAMAKAIDRRDTCRMASELLEKAALELYRLW